MEVNGQVHAPAALPPGGKNTGSHCKLQASWALETFRDGFGEQNTLLMLGFETRAVQAVSSWSLRIFKNPDIWSFDGRISAVLLWGTYGVVNFAGSGYQDTRRTYGRRIRSRKSHKKVQKATCVATQITDRHDIQLVSLVTGHIATGHSKSCIVHQAQGTRWI